MLGAGALGRPRGMVWGGRRVEGSGWETHVHLRQIHFDIWQNQYNIVKFKNKIKLKIKERKKSWDRGRKEESFLKSFCSYSPRRNLREPWMGGISLKQRCRNSRRCLLKTPWTPATLGWMVVSQKRYDYLEAVNVTLFGEMILQI